ncbi:MAG: FtsK/SpoIIIE domain-containing protein [Planctomycetota bacterium]
MPSEPLSTRRLLELMRDLQRCATERDAAEKRLEADRSQADRECVQRREAAAAAAERRYLQQKAEADARAERDRDRLEAAYEAARTGTQQEYHGLRSAAERDHRETSAEAQRRHRDEALVILSTFDAQKGEPKRRLDAFVAKLRRSREELSAIDRDARAILRARGLPAPAAAGDTSAASQQEESPADTADEAAAADADAEAARVRGGVKSAREAAQALYDDRLSCLLETPAAAGISLAGTLAGLALAGLVAGWGVAPMAVGGVAGLGLSLAGLYAGVRPRAIGWAQEQMANLSAAHREALAAIEAAAAAAEARSRREARSLIQRRDQDLAALGFEIDQLVSEAATRSGEQLAQAGEVFPARLAEFRTQHEEAMAGVEATLREAIGRITSERDAAVADAAAAEAAERQATDEQFQKRWRRLRDEWLDAYEGVRRRFADILQQSDARRMDFVSQAYADWPKPSSVAMGVPFGRAALDLATVKHGLPADARLRPSETRLELPAMVTLLEQPSLVVTAEGAGRRRAVQLMQAVMLRWLTSQPPGKVRLTILDAVGLGEGFNSFMHLADYDEKLIATRIWSAPRDIDEQLTRLTHHMETVLQKYLRSEYESIHEYNAQAGEVAEPFQVLVVNGFPTGFNDETAKRLVRLAAGGPRCGVFVVMSIDTAERLPTDFRMDDLLEAAVHLDWAAGAADSSAGPRFVWRYPAFRQLPLELDAPPPAERMVELVKQVGQAAKDAVRVEVPFGVVAPDGDAFWQSTCGDELTVPIGRAGANRLQHVRLGRGTSQHLLVAGKTGSGKSTFLHALVTSAAMHYGPDEVEFYLVDFKKGVEFKPYATHRLPHARVVAIESEREFGISVLERLDQELSRRGELYRAAGVQNLADYRAAHPGEAMPRTLLVIDEFQELFVEDDRLAQDATLLLDRLVRQGRAFGMHVVLGTQTLAGAFSIARSTLGQIAVRVALECSEADAHLILSDERNTAARFLSRPGEAIYNDQNGLATANEPFQVVWLPDRERADRLAVIQSQAAASTNAAMSDLPPAVIFEGNAAADPAKNEALQLRIAEWGMRNDAQAATDALSGRPASGSPARDSAFRIPNSAFLGDSVAIRPATAVPFGRHGGANLLVVGADERSALGMLTVGCVSLAAADPAARVVVLDATRPGDASDGVWRRVADAAPGGFAIHGPSDAADALAGVAAEVARREAESDDTAPPVYVVVYNAGRFRDLRRSEDDFSFSVDKDKPVSPDKHLAEVLKSGPGVGVHALVWCDSYNASSRLFDRMTLREFALRVVMQMSAADSSNLIDTPAASGLKPHRAIFYSDETGATEKLRPYGPPSEAWLASLAEAAGSPPSAAPRG